MVPTADASDIGGYRKQPPPYEEGRIGWYSGALPCLSLTELGFRYLDASVLNSGHHAYTARIFLIEPSP